MSFLKIYHEKKKTIEEVISYVKSGDSLFVSGNAATPRYLLEHLAARKDLENVKLYHLLQIGEDYFKKFGTYKNFIHKALFVGPADREAVNDGSAEYIPCHLHEIPIMIKEKKINIDVAIIHTSPPDEHGFLSLGVEVIATKAAIQSAKIILAQVNRKMPRTLGDCFVHISQITALCEIDDPLFTLEKITPTEVEEKIAKFVVDLIEDGATLQVGIGGIPNAILKFIKGKKDLGIHTEMISDGIMERIIDGTITGSKKTLHPGKVVGTFILGSEELYNFSDNNPIFELHPSDYVNHPFIISKNDNMVAVNSAIEVDLTGQVCSDSIGTYIYSGFGGQVDFIKGACWSKNGKPIIAIPSTAKNGTVSKIVSKLRDGAGVVTTRADVRYVVTEYGIAELWGKSLKERAKALIEIAHPNFREELLKEAWERKLLPRLIYVEGLNKRGN
ncbi:MAG: acetyl-CoA hydrolase/transferase C-terminal domain-containing protein [Candidatus Hydrothermales bacterium]